MDNVYDTIEFLGYPVEEEEVEEVTKNLPPTGEYFKLTLLYKREFKLLHVASLGSGLHQNEAECPLTSHQLSETHRSIEMLSLRSPWPQE